MTKNCLVGKWVKELFFCFRSCKQSISLTVCQPYNDNVSIPVVLDDFPTHIGIPVLFIVVAQIVWAEFRFLLWIV